MQSIINLKKTILLTANYPKEGIEFVDLTHALAHPDALNLARMACANLCIDRDCVIVGIPTRGCLVAQLIGIASGSGARVVQLQKKGVGTPLPGAAELCTAGTVYSEGSTFLLDPINRAALATARRVVLCDDVRESGKTMDGVARAICQINPALSTEGGEGGRLPDLLQVPFVNVATAVSSIPIYALLQKKGSDITPGCALLLRADMLMTVRGVPSIPSVLDSTLFPCWAVYGPPSMRDHVCNYVTTHKDAFVGDVVWGRFPGGCPNIRYSDYNESRGVVHFLFFYDAAEEDAMQNYVVRELARNCRGRMKIAVLYMPQATMERADVPGTLATAKSFLDVLCADLPIVGEGRVEVEVLDIHQTAEAFYVPNNVRFVSRTLLAYLVPPEARIVAFPDDGAYKRFGHAFRGFTQVICVKKREGEKRTISVRDTIGPLPVRGNAVYLVDDLVRTGGTLMETAAVLKQLGALEVHVVFVHADFEPGRTHAFARCPYIDSITCTNSCAQKAYALELMGGSQRVHVKNAIHSGSSSVPPFLAVASENETKRVAAYNVFNHRCENKAICMNSTVARDVRGMLCMPVETGVPEQPVGDAEGLRGATHRLNYVLAILHGDIPAVAFESFMRTKEDGQVVDTVCAVLAPHGRRGATLAPAYSESAIPPQELATKAIADGTLVGEVLMKLYNLPAKDAWIDFFAANRGTRVEQLETALYDCYAKAYPQFVMPSGGR